MGSGQLNTGVAHPARVYDYLLGGKDNFQADRDAAQALIRNSPSVPTWARANRGFMARVVRYLAAQRGIRQFLDIGTGLPTSPNLHEVVQGVDPSSRVVYVDNDPIVLVHARALLTGTPQGRTAYVDADVRAVDSVLNAPRLLETVDLDRPVGLCMLAILHLFTDEEEVRAILDRLVHRLAPGSTVALSAVTDDNAQDSVDRTVSAARASGIQAKARNRGEVEALFAGLDLVDPGVALVHQWRPDDAARAIDAQVQIYGGLAVKH